MPESWLGAASEVRMGLLHCAVLALLGERECCHDPDDG